MQSSSSSINGAAGVHRHNPYQDALQVQHRTHRFAPQQQQQQYSHSHNAQGDNTGGGDNSCPVNGLMSETVSGKVPQHFPQHPQQQQSIVSNTPTVTVATAPPTHFSYYEPQHGDHSYSAYKQTHAQSPQGGGYNVVPAYPPPPHQPKRQGGGGGVPVAGQQQQQQRHDGPAGTNSHLVVNVSVNDHRQQQRPPQTQQQQQHPHLQYYSHQNNNPTHQHAPPSGGGGGDCYRAASCVSDCDKQGLSCFSDAMVDQLVQGPNTLSFNNNNISSSGQQKKTQSFTQNRPSFCGGFQQQHQTGANAGVPMSVQSSNPGGYRDLPDQDNDCAAVANCLTRGGAMPQLYGGGNYSIPVPNKIQSHKHNSSSSSGQNTTAIGCEDDDEPNFVDGVVMKTSEKVIRGELNGRVPYIHFPPVAEMAAEIAEVKAEQEQEDAEFLAINPNAAKTPEGKLKKSYHPVFFGQVLFSTTATHLTWLLLHLTGAVPTAISNHSPGCFTCYFTTTEECDDVLTLNKKLLFDAEGVWAAQNSYQTELLFTSANFWRVKQQQTSGGGEKGGGGKGGGGELTKDGNIRLPRGALVVELPVHGGGGANGATGTSSGGGQKMGNVRSGGIASGSRMR